MFVCAGCGLKSDSPFGGRIHCPGHPAAGACHFVSEANLEPELRPFFEEPMMEFQPDIAPTPEPQPDIAPAPPEFDLPPIPFPDPPIPKAKKEPKLPPIPPLPKAVRHWNTSGLKYTDPPKPMPFVGTQVIGKGSVKKVSKEAKGEAPPAKKFEKPSVAVRRRLIGKYPSDERRVWKIVGEDRSSGGAFDRPDCPQLGLVEGTYEKAVDYALSLSNFISYGQGGTIEPAKKIPIKKLD